MIRDSKLIGTVIDEPFGWKEFKIDDVIDHVFRGSRLTKNNRKLGSFPFVTAGKERAGIAEYINNEENVTFSNALTIDMFGNCFYRDYGFKADDNILIFESENKLITKSVWLFIKTAIARFIEKKFDYSKQFRLQSVETVVITLPVTEQGTPDYVFMETYIHELEHQHIRELENQRIRELETYLQVTGLSDNILSDEEKAVLEQWRQHEQSLGGGALSTLEFRVGDLFILKNTKAYNELPDDMVLSSNDTADVPFVTTQFNNNGIAGFSELPPLNSGNRITYSDTTTGDAIFYQPNAYIGRSHVIYMEPEFDGFNKYVAMFVMSLIRKQTSGRFDYGKKLNKQAMYDMVLDLPVTPDNQPDYDFMETFIRAQEKLAVKRLSEFRKEQIKMTKAII